MERLTLLDIVKKLISSDEYGPDVQWCLSELRDILEIVGDMSGDRLRELVQADVAPVVHGRWLCGEDMDIQCSVCGADALTQGDYRQITSKYCPKCGAKMDLEE